MKILALYGPEEFSRYYDADVYPIYREVTGWQKKLFKLYEHIHIGNIETWLADWKYNIEQYDLIFIVDGIRGRDVLEYIRSRNQRARIIIYYVNPIDPTDRKAPANYQGLGCEFYTFDPEDAVTYDIKYKHWYYSEPLQLDGLSEQQPIRDIFFCAVDKGRLHYVQELKRRFDDLGLQTRLIVVKSSDIKYTAADKQWLQQPISYQDVISNIKEARAVLDIVQNGQHGITLRPMEAMFYNRKLITNNPEVKRYDFYDPQNVFILQECSLEQLPSFLQTPVREVPKEIKEQYEFAAWGKEFFNDALKGGK